MEEESGKGSKRKEQPADEWAHRRQVGAMKAFQLVLFLILLGSSLPMVRAVEQEISTRQELDRTIGFTAQRAAIGAGG